MNIIVSGASGFIGRNLARVLKDAGHEVIPIKIFLKDSDSLHCQKDHLDQQLQKIAGQIGRTDTFVHLAWMETNNWHSSVHKDINKPLSEHLISVLVSNGVSHVIVAGTCLEYGAAEGQLNEHMEVNPQNMYASSKTELYKSLTSMADDCRFDLTWMRLFYIYGADQPANTLYGSLKEHIRVGAKKFDMSPGQQVRDYLHIKQLCIKIKILVQSHRGQGVVNISSGRGDTLERHVRNWLIELKAEEEIELNLGALPYRLDESFSFWGDSQKFSASAPK